MKLLKRKKRLGITAAGELTWGGQTVDHCPQPFDDCRYGACDCDGIRDHWRMWGPCNRTRAHKADERCFGAHCASHDEL